ncbi:MAG: type II toxin-antitoxin system VapC family toxin [Caulobacteraceae bacterium]
MDLPDVNVLVYAFRRDLEHHPACADWLRGVLDDEAPFALSPLTLSAVVRIVTNRRSFRQPSPLSEAFTFCEDLMAQPGCQLVEPGRRHWSIFRRLCEEANIAGGDVTDAWYAALAIEHGCDWITMDRGFARYPGLRWRSPTRA